jgi:hypothetical protein
MPFITRALVAFLLPGCWILHDPAHDPPDGAASCRPHCDVDADPGPPPPDADPGPWFAFPTYTNARFAAGATWTLDLTTGDPLTGITVISSDPSVLTVTAPNDRTLRVYGVAPGTASLIASRSATGVVLDSLELTAVDIASIELHARAAPGADGPVDSLAALAGSTDDLAVSLIDAAGAVVPGQPTYAVDGVGLTVSGHVGASRLSDLFVARSDRFGLIAGSAGATAELVVSLGTGQSRSFPIEVVAAPAALALITMVVDDAGALVVEHDPVEAGEPIGTDIIGRTTNGRFVAGVGATWTSTGASINVWLDSGTELVFDVPAAGTTTIHAAVDTRSVTDAITAQPAAP